MDKITVKEYIKQRLKDLSKIREQENKILSELWEIMNK